MTDVPGWYAPPGEQFGDPEPQAYVIAVEVPARLPDELKDSLFTAVADAVHEWEPAERDGWDVSVTASTT